MISEKNIIDRVGYLRDSMVSLEGQVPSDMSKVDYLKYYCTLSRIDELLELLPKNHWFRKEE